VSKRNTYAAADEESESTESRETGSSRGGERREKVVREVLQLLTQNVNDTDKDSGESCSTESHDLFLLQRVTQVAGKALRTDAIEAFTSIQVLTDTAVHARRVETLVVIGAIFAVDRLSIAVFASDHSLAAQ
jgi:hypothetical protein